MNWEDLTKQGCKQVVQGDQAAQWALLVLSVLMLTKVQCIAAFCSSSASHLLPHLIHLAWAWIAAQLFLAAQ